MDYSIRGDGGGDVPVSVSLGPETLDPSPYEISNVPFMGCDVFDAEAVYFCFWLQAAVVQFAEGTQRSAEPAVRLVSMCEPCRDGAYVLSKSMRKFCGGVPIEISPAHSES